MDLRANNDGAGSNIGLGYYSRPQEHHESPTSALLGNGTTFYSGKHSANNTSSSQCAYYSVSDRATQLFQYSAPWANPSRAVNAVGDNVCGCANDEGKRRTDDSNKLANANTSDRGSRNGKTRVVSEL